MNNKGANIDLLFRNGLKDLEVLPPPGVWENISSTVKVKSHSFILLRVAALITILVTVSFLTYRWNQEMSDGRPSESVVAFNIPATSPETSTPVDNHQYLTVRKSTQVKRSAEIMIEPDIAGTIPQDIEMTASAEQMRNIEDVKNLSIANNKPVSETFRTPYNPSSGNAIKITYPDLKNSQENVAPKPENRWSVAAMASPTYYSQFTSGNNDLSKQITSSEEPLFSYSGGVAFSYKISKRFSIQSGLYYSSIGQKVDGINSYSGFQNYEDTKGGPNFAVLTTSGTIKTSNPDVFLTTSNPDRIQTNYTKDVFDPVKASLQPINSSLNQNFSYLELPVILKYKIVDKTFGINLIGGLSYNLLVHNSVYTILNGSKYDVGGTEGLNILTLSSSFGMGMEYNFSEKLSLNLEPTFRYYLNPLSTTTSSFIHPYSFGIFSGLSFKF